jgi:hypothetical protein
MSLVESFSWIAVILMINTVIGAIVWALIDNVEGDLYKWYSDAPIWPCVVQFIILNLWPVGVCMFIWKYYYEKTNI